MEPPTDIQPAAPALPFDVRDIYHGSDGDATQRLYKHLEGFGPAGVVATNLFRACKCSARAKKYRGGNGKGSYRSQAYDRKNWSIGNLCTALKIHAPALGITWGWKEDKAQAFHCWVLYIDLPDHGQVSFHSERPLTDHRYPGDWDGTHHSALRIMQYTEALLSRCV